MQGHLCLQWKWAGQGGGAYNIGTGVSTDFNTIYEIIKEEMNSRIKEYVPKFLYKIVSKFNFY